MSPISQIQSRETPRTILEQDFKLVLPIRGGWGYTKDDACIIDKLDPIVNPAVPFNGVAIESIFVEKRIYEELIVFRRDGDKFSGIGWTRIQQEVMQDDQQWFDKLVFDITAIPDAAWYELKAEWEGPKGHSDPSFDKAAHSAKRKDRTITFQREFWFDITSFFPVR